MQLQAILGTCLLRGFKVKQDYDLAFELLNKAAGQGFPPAMEAVAHCYEYGLGVEQNAVAAELWYNKAKESKE